jgi:hypothetical protein
MSGSLLALAIGAKILVLILSPISFWPLSATRSLKAEPGGTLMGAKGWPAYLSLMYLRKRRTRI